MDELKGRIACLFERFSPPIIGLAFSAAYFFICDDRVISVTAIENLFTATISVAAITIGFLATTKSILFTIDHKRIIRLMKEAGQYNKLVDFIFEAIVWSSVLLLISMGGLILDFGDKHKIEHAEYRLWGFCVWLFLFVAAAVAHHRIVCIFARILKFKDS